jgi:hypothetical protein
MSELSDLWLAAEGALEDLQAAIDADLATLLDTSATTGGALNNSKAATATAARAAADGALAALRVNGGRTGRKLAEQEL